MSISENRQEIVMDSYAFLLMTGLKDKLRNYVFLEEDRTGQNHPDSGLVAAAEHYLKSVDVLTSSNGRYTDLREK